MPLSQRKQPSISATFKSEYKKLPLEHECENIAKILPDDLYKAVARIVGLDEDKKEKMAQAKRSEYKRLYKGIRHLSRALQPIVTLEKEPSEEYEDTTVEPPSPRLKPGVTPTNPYLTFLQKSEREQVLWKSKYLPPETEKEKGLLRRADDITNKICSEFSTYMEELGGYDSPIFKKETVKELFQIEFNTHASRSLLVHPKDLPSVPEQVAAVSNNPRAAREKFLNKIIMSDIAAEKRKFHTVAFSKQLPKSQQWRPPKNNTKKSWIPTEHLPKELISMENVWGGITKLKSVQEYCRWMINHPDFKRPAYLKKSGMLSKKKLEDVATRNMYDKDNVLARVNVEELLAAEQSGRKMSVPPDEIKMIDFDKFTDTV